MRFGMNLGTVGGMCEMAQDVYRNLFVQSDVELALVGLTAVGESTFTAYGSFEGLGSNYSVTLRFRVLPSEDYLCLVQMTWATRDGHCVDRPQVYFSAPQLAKQVANWFVDMEEMNRSWVGIFGAMPG